MVAALAHLQPGRLYERLFEASARPGQGARPAVAHAGQRRLRVGRLPAFRRLADLHGVGVRQWQRRQVRCRDTEYCEIALGPTANGRERIEMRDSARFQTSRIERSAKCRSDQMDGRLVFVYRVIRQ